MSRILRPIVKIPRFWWLLLDGRIVVVSSDYKYPLITYCASPSMADRVVKDLTSNKVRYRKLAEKTLEWRCSKHV